MNWLLRLLRGQVMRSGGNRQLRASHLNVQPQTPPGFIRRSDPNFYFLARKF